MKRLTLLRQVTGSGHSIKDVANLLYKHRISGMPVVDEYNRVVGEISERELILAALPDFAERAQREGPDPGPEPFEALLKRENQITVRDLMKPPVSVVEKYTPLAVDEPQLALPSQAWTQ